MFFIFSSDSSSKLSWSIFEPSRMICRNSSNSISCEPSSSTIWTIYYTCYLFSTRPSAIRGSSRSSTPSAASSSSSSPSLSSWTSANESKHFLNLMSYSSSKSIMAPFPCLRSQFLWTESGWKTRSSGFIRQSSSSESLSELARFPVFDDWFTPDDEPDYFSIRLLSSILTLYEVTPLSVCWVPLDPFDILDVSCRCCFEPRLADCVSWLPGRIPSGRCEIDNLDAALCLDFSTSAERPL